MNAPAIFDLTGSTALVTGAGKGIGRAIALGLAQAGADIVLHGRSQETVEKAQREISAIGRNATVWAVDLSDPLQIPQAAQELPDIDILVNNAGIIYREPATTHPYEAWRNVLSVNLDAVFHLTQTIGAGMISRGKGKVITIASLLSFQGGLYVPGYTASKHAVAGLTKALAVEWTSLGVQVNAIAPGYIATDNTRALRENPQRETEIRSRIPADRWGRPEDLVGAAVFLASPASDYVAGHVLVVDGGWMAR